MGEAVVGWSGQVGSGGSVGGGAVVGGAVDVVAVVVGLRLVEVGPAPEPGAEEDAGVVELGAGVGEVPAGPACRGEFAVGVELAADDAEGWWWVAAVAAGCAAEAVGSVESRGGSPPGVRVLGLLVVAGGPGGAV